MPKKSVSARIKNKRITLFETENSDLHLEIVSPMPKDKSNYISAGTTIIGKKRCTAIALTNETANALMLVLIKAFQIELIKEVKY